MRAPPAPPRFWFRCAVWACVLGFGFRLRPASPMGAVGVCVCLCARPAWSPAPPGWGCCAEVRVCARAPLVPRLSWLGCGVWACVLGPGLGCASPFLDGLSGCVFCAFFLRVFVWRCGVGCWLSLSRALWFLSPHPLSFGLGCWLFFFFFSSVVCVCIFPCLLSRWAAVPGLVLPVLAGWSPCASLWVPSSVPSGWGVWPPLVVLAGGLVAVGCSLAPPPLPPCSFFLGGGPACSSLCLPWAGAHTDPHSVWSSGLLLAVAFCLAVSRPHGSGRLCTRWARRPFLPG